MKLQTAAAGWLVFSQFLMGMLLIWLAHSLKAALWQEGLSIVIWCGASAWLTHRWVGRRLAAPLQELVLLSRQVASHPDVPRLGSSIREIVLLEDSLRSLAADLASAQRLTDSNSLSSEAAHELRSSLGAVKNALYYVKEVCSEQRIYEKDSTLPEIINHAELEIEKAAHLAGSRNKKGNG